MSAYHVAARLLAAVDGVAITIYIRVLPYSGKTDFGCFLPPLVFSGS